MYPCIPIGIILRLWLDETVVAIHNLTIPYYHNAHGANAGSLLVGSLKIYRCKILHECKVTNFRCIIQIFNIYISILVCHFAPTVMTVFDGNQEIIPLTAFSSRKIVCAHKKALSLHSKRLNNEQLK